MAVFCSAPFSGVSNSSPPGPRNLDPERLCTSQEGLLFQMRRPKLRGVESLKSHSHCEAGLGFLPPSAAGAENLLGCMLVQCEPLGLAVPSMGKAMPRQLRVWVPKL